MSTVNHTKFGKGTIVSQDANNVTVDFNGTVKVMIIKFANLTNEDGTPFGEAFVAEKKVKKTNCEKMMAWRRNLTEQEKREINFENADGTTNWEAKNDFIEERAAKAMASKSW